MDEDKVMALSRGVEKLVKVIQRVKFGIPETISESAETNGDGNGNDNDNSFIREIFGTDPLEHGDEEKTGEGE